MFKEIAVSNTNEETHTHA